MSESSYSCRICERDIPDRTGLVEHLRTDHETLEVASYAANTMIGDQERDETAREFHRRFERLKEELVGHQTPGP